MKLPAVWMFTALAAGIWLGGRWHAPVGASAGACVGVWAGACAAAIILGCAFAWRSRAAIAWGLALAAWVAIGGVAVSAERAGVPADHVTRLIGAGQLDTSEPLRWRGRLREDPLKLPWGQRYEIDLEQVEVRGESVPVSGGLRANLYRDTHKEQTGGPPVGLRAGDRVEALLKARPPRNFLDPGAFDLRVYLALQKVDLTGSLRSGELLQLFDRPSPTLAQRLARARGALLARIDVLFPGKPQIAAVLRAMLLGDRSFVESDTVLAFQKIAAYHVLVVAGLHVGALVAFLFWVCRRLRLSLDATSFVTIAALAAYVAVVQDRAPILRAGLMAGLFLCARPLFRRIELLNTVALAALAMLLWKPSSLGDSSFQLSFVAAGVIAGLALPWIERTSAPYRAGLQHLGDVTRDGMHPPKIAQFRIEAREAAKWIASRTPQWLGERAYSILATPIRAGLRLWEIVLLSLVIQWGMLPLMEQDFHRVSLSGPVSNIPAVLLTAAIVPLGFLMLATSFVWAGAAALMAKAAGFCAALLIATAEWFSRVPRASYRIPEPPIWLTIAFFAVFLGLAAVARRRAQEARKRGARRSWPAPASIGEWGLAMALIALTVAVAIHPSAPNLPRGKFEVNVLDVGQGDSIFTAFPDGRTMLIDGGGLEGSERIGGYQSGMDVGEDVVSPYLWSRGIKRIDVVALTHAHHDHLDGLHSVIENFRVGELWVGRDEETPAFERLLAEAQAQGVRIVHKIQGATFEWGRVTGEFLWPPDVGPVNEASNDDSLVLRITDGSLHFLLTGDAQQRSENALVASHSPLAADFLKVPHHGSKTSSTEGFVAAVAPRVAVVSVGEGNPFRQPAETTVERYARAGVRLLRTDCDGEVTAASDGRTLSVRAFSENLCN